MDLNNKSVVIVGASSGLGKALAELLSKEGVKLFPLSRTSEISVDVKDPVSIRKAFQEVDSKTDRIDVMINCAGVGLIKDFKDVSASEINNVIDTDLKGAIFICQETYKRMVDKKSGHIINVVSTSGLKARAMETVYCAAKWGLRGFTDSLQLAGEEKGVRVTAVYPGGMRSENFWKVDPGRDISEYLDPMEVAKKIIELIKGEYQKELTIERPKK